MAEKALRSDSIPLSLASIVCGEPASHHSEHSSAWPLSAVTCIPLTLQLGDPEPGSGQTMKMLLKHSALVVFLVLALPLAAIAGFGGWGAGFRFSSHVCALIPGGLGDYLRIAFYKLTLKECSLNSCISFGSVFARSSASVGKGVYVGAYCVLGSCSIGDRTQIASHVQVLSGRRQHIRDVSGTITGSEDGEFEQVEIGADCWIGASAIVMAGVGASTTIGAGAVVVKPIESGVVAVGNPARVLRRGSV
jgi:virginiamycin A acetyltransferase